MLASEWCPLAEHWSQESEIGETHGSEIETLELEHLLDDDVPIDNCGNSLLEPLDPYQEQDFFNYDHGNQDQNAWDNYQGSESDEEVPAIGSETSSEHDPSGGSWILGGPEKSALQTLDSDGNSMQLMRCSDQSNEVGTCVHGKPVVTVWSRGPWSSNVFRTLSMRFVFVNFEQLHTPRYSLFILIRKSKAKLKSPQVGSRPLHSRPRRPTPS